MEGQGTSRYQVLSPKPASTQASAQKSNSAVTNNAGKSKNASVDITSKPNVAKVNKVDSDTAVVYKPSGQASTKSVTYSSPETAKKETGNSKTIGGFISNLVEANAQGGAGLGVHAKALGVKVGIGIYATNGFAYKDGKPAITSEIEGNVGATIAKNKVEIGAGSNGQEIS